MPTSHRFHIALALALALIAAACSSSTAATGSPAAADVPAATTAASEPAASIAGSAAAPASTAVAAASPAAPAIDCATPATPTIAQTEGPYYRTGATESSNLVTDGMPGTRLTLTGYVVDTSCTPIANAKVETWQADSTGAYDNAGYALPRGKRHRHIRPVHDRDDVACPANTRVGRSTSTSRSRRRAERPSRRRSLPAVRDNGEDRDPDPSLDLVVAPDGDALTGTYTFVLGS